MDEPLVRSVLTAWLRPLVRGTRRLGASLHVQYTRKRGDDVQTGATANTT